MLAGPACASNVVNASDQDCASSSVCGSNVMNGSKAVFATDVQSVAKSASVFCSSWHTLYLTPLRGGESDFSIEAKTCLNDGFRYRASAIAICQATLPVSGCIRTTTSLSLGRLRIQLYLDAPITAR